MQINGPARRMGNKPLPNTSSQPTPTTVPNPEVKQRPSRPVAQRQGPNPTQFKLNRITQQKTQQDDSENPFLNALKRRKAKR